MSVSTSLTLPAVGTGGTTIRPLGGDGYSSPISFYLVEQSVASDASGGTNTITINMDSQYQAVVSLMQTKLASAAADRLVKLEIFPEGLFPTLSIQGTQVNDADVGSNLMYTPPPLFPVVRIRSVVDNVDTETFTLRAVIYSFKRDAFQKVPLNVLLDSLPRGFSIQ